MGRGLSELQKCILRLALRNIEHEEQREWRNKHGGVNVVYSEILNDYFGRHGNVRSAQAAICRAVLRLEQRGLVVSVRGLCKWAGADLTPAGLQQARELSVNEVPNWNLVNH